LQLISIIIPAFNTEKYLAKTLQSATGQSYRHTEIIIINDGSNDQTPEIANAFKQKDSRITIIDQKNQGLSAARNTGIRHANGQIIAFLDSDDWWHPEYLEKMAFRLSRSEQLGMSFSRIQYADDAGNVLPMFTRGHVKNIKRHDFLYMNPLSCGSNMVIKKRFLSDIGFFDESLKRVEDLDFLYRAASHRYFQISGIKEYLVYYRIREGLTFDMDLMETSWKQFMEKVKQSRYKDFAKHYLPAFISQKLFYARKAQQLGLSSKVTRSYLFYCLKHPIALLKLSLLYPVLVFYSFPKTLISSLFPAAS